MMHEDATLVARSVNISALQSASLDRALLLVLSGPAVGQTFAIGPQSAVLGRAAGNEALIPDPEMSRQHARIELAEGGFVIDDLGSVNGTFVNGARVQSRSPLRDGDRIQLGPLTMIKFSLLDPLEAAVQQRLHEAIHADVLTGARNRRYLETRLPNEFALAKRHQRPLCLLMLDIDNFKQVNDVHGHPVGDIVLCELAARLMHEVRAEDVLVRYGGEEFLIVARELSPQQGLEFAERMRSRVQAEPMTLPDGTQLPITVSVGVASLRQGVDSDPAAIIARADAALYRVKQGGRNRVEYDA
jgi:diguanylate cyclase (GGDEF)-like protein